MVLMRPQRTVAMEHTRVIQLQQILLTVCDNCPRILWQQWTLVSRHVSSHVIIHQIQRVYLLEALDHGVEGLVRGLLFQPVYGKT